MFKNKKTIIIIGVVICVAVIIFLFWDNIKKMFSKKEDVAEEQTTNTNTGNGGGNTNNNNTNTTSNAKNVIAVSATTKADVGLFPRNNNSTVLKLFKNNQIIGKYEGVDGLFFLVDWDGIKGKVLVSKSKLQ